MAGQGGPGGNAAAVRGTTLLTLPGLAAGGGSGANALSRTGTIAGFAWDAGSVVHAATWRCGR